MKKLTLAAILLISLLVPSHTTKAIVGAISDPTAAAFCSGPNAAPAQAACDKLKQAVFAQGLQTPGMNALRALDYLNTLNSVLTESKKTATPAQQAAIDAQIANNNKLITANNKSEQKALDNATPTSCSINPLKFSLFKCANVFISWLLDLIVIGISWVLWIANELFNLALLVSIRNFKAVADIPGILTGWKIIRDLMNLLFIGSLFYIAINTILQTSQANWKKDVPKIIIAALLINFSMLFTRIMIDASNLLTITFYDNLANGQEPTAGGSPDISTQLLKNLSLHKGETAVPQKPGDTTPRETAPNDIWQIIAGSLGKIVMFLVASYVLLVAAILFIIRSVVLIFLLVLSPFAFLGMILPKFGSQASKWWGTLSEQLIFAPAYMFCFFVTVQIVNSASTLKEALVGPGAPAGSEPSLASIVMFFIMINGLLFGCIFVAKSMGAKGAQFAQQTAGGAIAAPIARVGQETIGRMAAKRAENLRGQLQDPNLDPAKRARLESQLTRADKLSKSSFDLRKTKSVQTLGKVGGADFGKASDTSFAKRREDSIKAEKERAKNLTPQTDLEKAEAKERNKDYLEENKTRLDNEIGNAYTEEAKAEAGAKQEASDQYEKDHGSKMALAQGELTGQKGIVAQAEAEGDLNDIAIAKQDQAKIEEKIRNLDKEKISYIAEQIKENENLNAVIARRVAIEKQLEDRGGESEGKRARIRRDAGGNTKQADENIKAYQDRQAKQKKHFESGGYVQEKYAESVAAGKAGSFYVPGTNLRVPFSSTNISTKRGNAFRAAGVKEQASGETDEQALARLARKAQKKEDDEKNKVGDGTTTPTPTTPAPPPPRPVPPTSGTPNP